MDPHDRVIGAAEKWDAHRRGQLHRAFSVFVFDHHGRLLLQRRARGKYHSGGLWSNTCCGHPRPPEDVLGAASRRLREEMGIACGLREVGTFTYRCEVSGGLTEHELDHVLVGAHEGPPLPDPAEVGAWRWSTMREIAVDLRRSSAQFTVWFRQALALAATLEPS